MLPGPTYAYVLNGTSGFYAALDVALGKWSPRWSISIVRSSSGAFSTLIDRSAPMVSQCTW